MYRRHQAGERAAHAGQFLLDHIGVGFLDPRFRTSFAMSAAVR
nr:hypothetical protein [Streptomyces halstedii]